MNTRATRLAAAFAVLSVAPCVSPGLAGAAVPLMPNDFAYGMPVMTTGDASAYRVTLPIEVYRSVQRPDLGDIRVFNAQGQAVPFALHGERPASLELTWQSTTLFPLRPRTPVYIDGVRVSIASSGAAVNLETQRGANAPAHVMQYLIDARRVSRPMTALRLLWLAGAPDYSGRVRVEASDDLGSWRILADGAPIANLHAAGQELIENTVTLPNERARFLKLTWMGESPGFDLQGIAAGVSETPPADEPASVAASGEPGAEAGALYFDLRAHLPVERLNLQLPDPNTVVQVEFASRDRTNASWHTVVRAGFYRLKNATGEQTSKAVDVPVDRDRYWRARVVAPDGTPMPPGTRLLVGWTAAEVAFLARGTGPFLVAYGSASAAPAFADLHVLPLDLQIMPAALDSARELGGPARLQSVQAPNRKPLILWAALIVGVALLGWMAWRLFNETR